MQVFFASLNISFRIVFTDVLSFLSSFSDPFDNGNTLSGGTHLNIIDTFIHGFVGMLRRIT